MKSSFIKYYILILCILSLVLSISLNKNLGSAVMYLSIIGLFLVFSFIRKENIKTIGFFVLVLICFLILGICSQTNYFDYTIGIFCIIICVMYFIYFLIFRNKELSINKNSYSRSVEFEDNKINIFQGLSYLIIFVMMFSISIYSLEFPEDRMPIIIMSGIFLGLLPIIFYNIFKGSLIKRLTLLFYLGFTIAMIIQEINQENIMILSIIGLVITGLHFLMYTLMEYNYHLKFIYSENMIFIPILILIFLGIVLSNLKINLTGTTVIIIFILVFIIGYLQYSKYLKFSSSTYVLMLIIGSLLVLTFYNVSSFINPFEQNYSPIFIGGYIFGGILLFFLILYVIFEVFLYLGWTKWYDRTFDNHLIETRKLGYPKDKDTDMLKLRGFKEYTGDKEEVFKRNLEFIKKMKKIE